MENMTAKQKRFCDEYLISLNATQAAIKAGYSKKYANTNVTKLLQNTTIKKYIDSRLKEVEDKSIADLTEVMRYLTKGMRQELEEEVVLGNGDVVKRKISPKDSNKCAEMLAKRYGILTDQSKMQLEVIVPVFGGEEELED